MKKVFLLALAMALVFPIMAWSDAIPLNCSPNNNESPAATTNDGLGATYTTGGKFLAKFHAVRGGNGVYYYTIYDYESTKETATVPGSCPGCRPGRSEQTLNLDQDADGVYTDKMSTGTDEVYLAADANYDGWPGGDGADPWKAIPGSASGQSDPSLMLLADDDTSASDAEVIVQVVGDDGHVYQAAYDLDRDGWFLQRPFSKYTYSDDGTSGTNFEDGWSRNDTASPWVKVSQ